MNLILFSLTFVGAISLYLLSRAKGIKSFSILNAINIDTGFTCAPWVIIVDAIITSLLGSIVAFFITQPNTNPSAIAAGLSFTGILNAFGTTNETK